MVKVAQVVDLDVGAAVCGAAAARWEALLCALSLPAIVCLVLLPHHEVQNILIVLGVFLHLENTSQLQIELLKLVLLEPLLFKLILNQLMSRLCFINLLSEVFDIEFQFCCVVIPLIVLDRLVGPQRCRLLSCILRLSTMIQILLIKHCRLLMCVLSHMLQSAQIQRWNCRLRSCLLLLLIWRLVHI